MTQPLDFHRLIHLPAHQLVEQVYQTILERSPSFAEHAYHLARLNRGCSRKLFVLSILYSPEGQGQATPKQLSGGRLLTWFARLATGRPARAKFMIKLMHYADVVTGRAREFAYQFQAEWQLYAQQETEHRQQALQQQQQALRTEAHMLQQDVQRRVDLFLLEAMQTLSGKTLSPAEKDAWRRQLEQASRSLHS